jgi:alpha-beta hydrolase superfamily lysophospholipase
MERFIVEHHPDGRRALLLHGLTGSPIELWPLAEGLAAAGWRVELPLWPGHGTTPRALAQTPPSELVEEARTLGREGADAIVGFSMGGLLAMVAAAESPRPLRLVLLAPAVTMTGGARLFDRLGRLPWLPSGLLVDKGGPEPAAVQEPELSRSDTPLSGPGRTAMAATPPAVPVRYDRVPLVWARHLRTIRGEARRAAAALTGTALALHGTADRTADAASLDRLPDWSPGVSWDRRRIEGAPHQLSTSSWRGVVADDVARFLDRETTRTLHANAG